MIRRIGGVALLALVVALTSVPDTAWSQEATVPQDAPETTDARPLPSRQEWVILMAILGEQLPEDASLTGVIVDQTGNIMLTVNGGTPESVVSGLRPYFAAATVGERNGAATTVHIRGIPSSLGEYRSLKQTKGSIAVAPAPVTPAVEPSPPTAQAVPPVPQEVWPPLRVRRVFLQKGTRMVQLTLDGRDYIVREGSLFSSNAYRLVGMATGADGNPSERCAIIERVSTAVRRDVCLQ